MCNYILPQLSIFNYINILITSQQHLNNILIISQQYLNNILITSQQHLNTLSYINYRQLINTILHRQSIPLLSNQLKNKLKSSFSIFFMHQSHQQPSNLIYYSLPNKKAYLHPLQLPFTHFHPLTFAHSHSRQSKLEALTYREPLLFLGKQYAQLLVVCTPAISIEENQTKKQQAQGFIKVNYQTKYPCYLSGKRSAIIKKDVEGEQKYHRLKGCGNMLSGFVHEKGNGLRGSHFFHTSKRQMLMTHEINKALEKRGRIGANIPIGYFQYCPGFIDQIEQEKKVSDDLPRLLKFCCLFQTKGQRRLGTHLISSLDILLFKCLQIKFEDLKQLFKKHQRYSNAPQQTPIEWDFDQINEEKTFIQGMLNKNKENRQPLNLINYLNMQASNQVPIVYPTNHESIAQDIVDTFSISQPYSKILENKLSMLLQKQNLLKIILLLGSRIGHQVGQIKRIFTDQTINWGFFDDHNITHCNAHLNNFVILQPLQKYNGNILAPLDFDLSFKKQEYMSIDRQNPKYGQYDPIQFQNLLVGEYKALQLSISGLEVMNFKYGIHDESISQSRQTKEKQQMLRYLLRDQILESFRKGFLNEDHKNEEGYKKQQNSIRQLIQICLIISMDFQT